MAAHNELGKFGEDLAAQYLEQKGWYIRHRDWRYDKTDIDIVCIDEDDTILVFVEVKTRSTDEFGKPEDAVDAEKRRNIVHAAEAYMQMFHKENRNIRYDIISIVKQDVSNDVLSDTAKPSLLSDYKIEHIEDAFSLMDVFEDQREVGRRWYYRNKYGGY